MIQIERYSEQDHYEIVASWWKSRGFEPPQPGMLNREHGFIANINDSYVAALFLFPFKGSEIAYHGWPSSDPNKSRLDRNLALDRLYGKIENEARDLGYKWLWTESGVAPVESRLQRLGHIKGDENVNQYIKRI